MPLKRGRGPTRSWAERALDAVDGALAVTDLDGRIVSVNRAARSLLALTTAEVVGQGLDRLLTDPDAERLHVDRRPMFDGRRVVGQLVRLSEREEPSVPIVVDTAVETTRERLQQTVVNHLQEAVQPPTPDVPNTDLGVHYVSADPSKPTGGDLYDWYLLPDGDLHVVVVDVIGKGIGATKDALAVVHTLRVLVLEGFPLETIVATADRLLTAGNPDLVATLLIGRYTPATGRLVLAGGGHPPLLLVSADGEVEEVTAGGIPLGWPGASSFELVERTLDRSQTAVFYTDGLIEARRDILVGLRDLTQAASETATYPARQLPRILVERALASAQRRDDIVALVLRRRAAPTPATSRHLLGAFEHRFSPVTANLGIVRHFFEDWLRHQGIEGAELDDLTLVASELCTNAVRAASGEPAGVTFRAWPDGEDLVLEIEDDGPGFVPEPTVEEPPPPDVRQGRGLYVARALMDSLDVLEAGDGRGALVRCRRRCMFATSPPPGAAPAAWPRLSTRCTDFATDVLRDGARTRLTVSGDVDTYAAVRLEEAFSRSGAGPGRHLVVDLSGVTFIDSSGLGALTTSLRAAADTGAVVSLGGATPQVVKLFELTGLNHVLPLALPLPVSAGSPPHLG